MIGLVWKIKEPQYLVFKTIITVNEPSTRHCDGFWILQHNFQYLTSLSNSVFTGVWKLSKVSWSTSPQQHSKAHCVAVEDVCWHEIKPHKCVSIILCHNTTDNCSVFHLSIWAFLLIIEAGLFVALLHENCICSNWWFQGSVMSQLVQETHEMNYQVNKEPH